MIRAIAFAAVVAAAAAFTLPSSTHTRSGVRPLSMASGDMSESLPFIMKPKSLIGYAGDIGFDPLYLSDLMDIKWLRESELKHCRTAMIATVGFLVQEFIQLPGEAYSNPNSVEAFKQVGPQPLIQIFLFCGALEFILHKGKLTMFNMFEGERKPGDFGFDPLGFYKNPDSRARLELSELKNGRLAMLAIGGLVHHALITGHATFAQ